MFGDNVRFFSGAFGLLILAVVVSVQCPAIAADLSVDQRIQAAKAANDARIDFVEKQWEQYRQKLTQLQTLRQEGYASWLEVARAQLQVDRLQAHQGAARRMADLLDALRRRCGEENVDATASYMTGPGSDSDNPELWGAALRLAAAEAAAMGELRVAQAVRKRRELRLQAIRHLHSEGCATPRELEMADSDYTAARQFVEVARARRAEREEAYQRLRTETGEMDGDARSWLISVTQPANDSLADVMPASGHRLPPRLFADGEAIDYLITLRRGKWDADAVRSELRAELSMHKAICDKLRAIGRDDVAGRRELEVAELDVQYDRARLKATDERIQIFDLEEERFLFELRGRTVQEVAASTSRDSIERPDPKDPQYVAMVTHADRGGRVPVRLISHQSATSVGPAPAAAQADFGESHAYAPIHLDRLDLLVWRAGHHHGFATSKLQFEPDHFRMPPALLASLSATGPYPPLRTLDLSRRRCAGDAMFARHAFFDETYHRCYAFGIRRTDVDGHDPWRWRSSSHGGPWYLPGSPANYR